MLKKMPEIDIIRIINDPDSSEKDYQAAANFLVKKYENQIHKHWWTLQKELYSTGMADYYKDEFYEEAYDALLKAIRKVDPSRVYDKKFKIVQLASWYLSNARKKIRKRCLSNIGRTKYLNSMTRDYVGEDTSLIDPDVEHAYNESTGYRNDPFYSLSRKESLVKCREVLERCMSEWDSTELRIYRYLKEGRTRKEISDLTGIKPTSVYTICNNMKNMMREYLYE